MAWNKLIPVSEIKNGITPEGVKFAEEFGTYLAEGPRDRQDRTKPLTTSQLRKFFGEIKRQQMSGYNQTDIILLKPKLAYAVGRAKEKDPRGILKICDFNNVIAAAIDNVANKDDFKNFVQLFEAIVAYHKAAGGK